MDFEKYGITDLPRLLNFFMKNMKYGFTYGGKVFLEGKDFEKSFDKLYRLRTGEKFIQNGYGVCWDFCEFERLFCSSKNIPHECYFFLSFFNRAEGGPTHTFLIFEQDNKWYWFEYAWGAYRGIWEYSSKEEALKDIMIKFCNYNNRPYQKVEAYKTSKAKSGLNSFEFVEHCLKGEKAEILPCEVNLN